MPPETLPIYFGGSFNPFHRGHAAIITSLRQNFPDSNITVLPNSLSPFKVDTGNAGWPNAEQKKAMLQIALRELDMDSLHLEDYELQRSGPCYTADTLQAILASRECFFALGWDSFVEVPKWKNWQYLADTCRFLVFRRGSTGPSGPAGMEPYFERVRFCVFELDIPCSSSELRCLFAARRAARRAARKAVRGAAKRNIENTCLSPAVAAYIEKNGLYR